MSAASPLVIRVKCPYCGIFRSPRDIRPLGTGGARICFHCLDWHAKAMDALCRGVPPPGCQVCGLKFADLKECDNSGNLLMYLQVKDGIYQILCSTCSDRYELKRKDFFKDTAYGQRKGF